MPLKSLLLGSGYHFQLGDHEHLQRVRWAEYVGGLFVSLISLVSAVFFWAYGGAWAVVLANVYLLLFGLVSIALARLGKTWALSLRVLPLLMGGVVLGLGVSALFLDLPTVEVPRSVHVYFLPLGLFAYLAFLGTKPWLRHGMTLLCFLIFMLFSSTNEGIAVAGGLPASLRAAMAWINTVLAMLMFYFMLQMMQTNISSHAAFQNELRSAFRERQFLLHYQPQVNAQRQVVGAQVWLRWAHPLRGLRAEHEFAGMAGQIGLSAPLAYWMLESACRQLAVWAESAHTSGLSLAVHVSAEQLRQKDFVARVLVILAHTGAPAQQLELALSESALAHDVDELMSKMGALCTSGLRFSLGDFGTGYSSIAYLSKLPLGQLKIDPIFVGDMLTGHVDAAIARTVLALGKSLGLTVLADGVANQAQWQFLIDSGCERFQGSLFGGPQPIGVFEKHLREESAWVSAQMAHLVQHDATA